MKKIKYILITLLISLIYQVRVNASSLLVSCPSTANEGDTVTCTISATSDKKISGATGSITYSGVSYVTHSNLTGVSYFEVNNSGFDGVFDIKNSSVSLASYTFIAGSEGTAKVSTNCNVVVVGDEFDKDFDCTGSSATITISKNKTPEPAQNPENNNDNNNSSTNNTKKQTNKKKTNQNNTETPKTVEKSSNNELKELSIEGYSVIKEKDNKYTLMVDNDVEEIIIKASTKDEKATITGIGVKKIVDGDNKFEITVTAEDGTTKTYTLVVTREKKIDTNIEDDDTEDIKETVVEKKNHTMLYIFSILGVVSLIFIILIIFIIVKRKKSNN
ncbi:MAG: cadherin-like beta sandwich domain-containing protein [bacterium]|nr:cadherin-like beta sandwich domain-containing protein [bacterium]